MLKDTKATLRDAAIAHGAGTVEGNPTRANRAHDEVIEALKLLRRQDDQGKETLTELLADPNHSVRVWAAMYLLPLDEELAVAALEQLREFDATIIGFGAGMVLREWRGGRLKLLA